MQPWWLKILKNNREKTMSTINNYNFKNKKALIRVDFNVPLDAEKTSRMTRELELLYQQSYMLLIMEARPLL